MELIDKTEIQIPQSAPLCFIDFSQILSRNNNASLGRQIQTSEQIQQGRLSGTRASQNRQLLSPLNLQRYLSEHFQTLRPFGIGFAQIQAFKDYRHNSPSLESDYS